MSYFRKAAYGLWGAALVVGIIAAFIFISRFAGSDSDIVLPVLRQDGDDARTVLKSESAKTFSEYEEIFSKRNLFESSSITSGQADLLPGDQLPAGVKDAAAILDRYQLIGVLVDDQPRAVLQDRKTKETVFVFVGGKLEGILVESIMAGKIVLRVNGQVMELKL